MARAPPWTPGSRDDDAWKSTDYRVQFTEYRVQFTETEYSVSRLCKKLDFAMANKKDQSSRFTCFY